MMINLYNNIYILRIVKELKARKMIAVSVENYQKLKQYGSAGDSINVAVSRLLKLADLTAGGVVG
jgi:hypothetical protein